MSKKPLVNRKMWNLASISIIGVIVVAMLGCAWVQKVLNFDAGLGGSSSSEPEVAVEDDSTTNGQSAITVYFTDPDGSSQTAKRSPVLLETVAAIENAQTSIELAIYDINIREITSALINAHQRGVQVRIVTESENYGDGTMAELADAGIVVEQDKGNDGLMHNKFMVVDGQVVFTGSWNMNFGALRYDYNDWIKIQSPTLAANYQAEFNEMFDKGIFGAGSQTDNPRLQIGDVLVENYFAPDDGVAQRIVEYIAQAKNSIHFLAFSFTHREIAQAMLAQYENGLVLKGVIETRTVEDGQSAAWEIFTHAEAPVLLDGLADSTLHEKMIILDSETIITGSFNFTNSANNRNDENVLIIHDKSLALQFLNEFDGAWRIAGGE
ncbi:MAG TPA: phospholipase D-like domain-containing protein [Anaerolineales bacterium]|nr:phospholipase D-like domain-containing protein [Anaerolineales bacterium]